MPWKFSPEQRLFAPTSLLSLACIFHKSGKVYRCRAVQNFPLFVGLIFCFVASVKCQDTVTGAFEGHVTNSQTGASLKGASVEIVNQQTGITVRTETDYRGRFYQGLLIPGTYIVRVSLPGYETKQIPERIRISYPGEVVPVPVGLDPVAPAGSATPTPTPTLTIEDTDIRSNMTRIDGRRSGSFTSEEVSTLPLGGATVTRTFDELALLLPGIASPPQTLGSVAGPGVGAGVGSAGQFSANGLRSRGNNFTVDGSDNNDEDIGVRRQGFVALIPQPIESIQEYQVITLLAPAQFGRNIGAQVNAVSKSGGSKTHGALYGNFNSSQLNARNFFDTTFGNNVSTVRANNQDVLIQTRDSNGVVTSQQPLTVRNDSGGEDSFTFWRGGVVIGGPLKSDSLFYFASFETELTNATEEHSFIVPTVEQRGAFRTGATGIFQNPLTLTAVSAVPSTRNGSALFSLFPFPNNLAGIYGPNTFTETLPASSRANVLSGKIDKHVNFHGRPQSITGRYNFTNDWRDIPVTGGAIFSTLKSRVRAQNFSFFLNSKVSGAPSQDSIFNQVRLSYGRTRLRFDEVRDKEFLIPSFFNPETSFLLNARELLNVTTPPQPGIPNNGPAIFLLSPFTVEEEIGSIGSVNVAGFSPLGVDVFNFPQRRINNTYQAADELTYGHGTHRMTFGVDNRRSELNSDLPRNSRPFVSFNGSPRLILTNGVLRFPTANDVNPIVRAEDLAAMGAASNFFQTLNTVGNDASISLRYYQINAYAQDVLHLGSNLSLSYGLRYEYNTPPRELNRRIENTFNSSELALAPGLRNFIQDRTRIFNPDHNNFGPRFGVAYSPNFFGANRVTVFRGGYGIFYDQILGAVVSQSRNVFPTFLTLNFGGGRSFGQYPFSFDNPSRQLVGVPNVDFVPLVIPGTINTYNPQIPLPLLFDVINRTFPSALGATLPSVNLETPKAQHYSFAFEQQISSQLVVSIAYVGTRGEHLLRFTTPNLGPGLTLAPTSFSVLQREFRIPVVLGQVNSPSRAVAGVGAINQFETTGTSKYNSLQLSVRGRVQRSVAFNVAYTFSEVRDDVSDVFDTSGAFVLPQDSLNLAAEWGPANFDVRHRLTYYFTWNLDQLFPDKGARRFLHGLEISGSGRMQTGQPFTVNSTIDVNLDGNLTDRLNTTEGIVVTGSPSQPLILNTTNTLNLLAPFGQDGQIGRNTFRAGGVVELDLALTKKFRWSQNQSFALRLDFFNFLNRTNFGIPVRFLEAPAFGRAVQTTTPGRRVQVGVKYSF